MKQLFFLTLFLFSTTILISSNKCNPLINQLHTYTTVINPADIKIANSTDLKNIILDISPDWDKRITTETYAQLSDKKKAAKYRYAMLGKPLPKSNGSKPVSQRLQRLLRNKVNWKKGVYIVPYLVRSSDKTLIQDIRNINKKNPALIGIALYDDNYNFLGKDIICKDGIVEGNWSNGILANNDLKSLRIAFNERLFCWITYGQQLFVIIDNNTAQPSPKAPQFEPVVQSKISWL